MSDQSAPEVPMMHSKNAANQEDNGPWYRQFWAWFMLFPLIAVVISTSITVSIAVRHADDVVIDNYYKEGRMINQRRDEDALATSLGLAANIAFDQGVGELVVDLSGARETLPESLILLMSHPTSESQDQRFQLQHIGAKRYHAELVEPLKHRWYLHLSPQANTDSELANQWRLRGDIDFSRRSSVLLEADG